MASPLKNPLLNLPRTSASASPNSGASGTHLLGDSFRGGGSALGAEDVEDRGAEGGEEGVREDGAGLVHEEVRARGVVDVRPDKGVGA